MYPEEIWYSLEKKSWRGWIEIDFSSILQSMNEELDKIKHPKKVVQKFKKKIIIEVEV